MLRGGGRRYDAESETFVTHALTAEGHDASEDGTGRGTPIIPILEAGARTGKSTDDPRCSDGIGKDGDPMFTLQGGKQHAIAFSCKDHGADVGELSPTLRADVHDKSHENGGCPPAIAFNVHSKNSCAMQENGASKAALKTDVARAVDSAGWTAGQGGTLALGSAAQSCVRRLTPTECERLQGFPDGWTEGFSDSVRYRMLGNAVAVPCAQWIARRIKESSHDT